VSAISPRVAARIAWPIWTISVAFTVLALLFVALSGAARDIDASVADVAFEVAILVFSTVGVLVASRRPENRIGWIFLVAGTAMAVGESSYQYANYSLLTAPGTLPAGEWMAWLGAWVPAMGGLLIVTFGLLLFPDGRLPSRRWRPVAWLAACASAATVLGLAFKPGPSQDALPASNPVGIEGAGRIFELVLAVAGSLLVASFVASVTSLMLRFRRARGDGRQQLKWFAYAAAVLAASYALVAVLSAIGVESPWVAAQLGVAFLGLPIAVGIAILKYRLYDIDRIINRTLVYGALTAMLGLVYFGGVVGLQYVFRALTGQESQLAVVASTLSIAALFVPLRRRVQAFIDRRFYRRKYDAAKTLAAFSAKLRDETDLDTLGNDLVAVIVQTMQPAHVSLWLRSPEENG
jgi:hypothetical protein